MMIISYSSQGWTLQPNIFSGDEFFSSTFASSMASSIDPGSMLIYFNTHDFGREIIYAGRHERRLCKLMGCFGYCSEFVC